MKNYRIWIEQSRVTGYFPYVTLGAFYEDMISSTSQGIITIAAINDFSAFSEEGGEAVKSTPGGGYKAGEVPRIGNNEIELWGTALFNGDIMVESLTVMKPDSSLCCAMSLAEATSQLPSPKIPMTSYPLA